MNDIGWWLAASWSVMYVLGYFVGRFIERRKLPKVVYRSGNYSVRRDGALYQVYDGHVMTATYTTVEAAVRLITYYERRSREECYQ